MIRMSIWQVVVEYKSNGEIEKACRGGRIPVRVWRLENHLTGRKLSLRITIDADNIDAMTEHLREELTKLKEAIGDLDPMSIRLHADGIPEQVPELVRLADIARMMKISRQRVKQLADGDQSFPRPLACTPSTGNLYSRYTVEAWADARDQALDRGALDRGNFVIQPVMIVGGAGG
jgi:hypothetical protein